MSLLSEEQRKKLLKAGIKAPHVNETCIGCSACVAISEDVFELNDEGLSEVKLNGYLKPEPLSLVDDTMHIAPEILANCEPTVMQRYHKQEDRISEKLEHNEAGLYEVLESMKAA